MHKPREALRALTVRGPVRRTRGNGTPRQLGEAELRIAEAAMAGSKPSALVVTLIWQR